MLKTEMAQEAGNLILARKGPVRTCKIVTRWQHMKLYGRKKHYIMVDVSQYLFNVINITNSQSLLLAQLVSL